MKTIKELDHILFRRPLGLNDGLWLSVAVGSFFHLDEPEKTATEIDLWKLAAETLGKDALLDAASPKKVGEFMVCGSCWSATGAPIVSSEVEVRVGEVAKRLTVYGDREWLPPGSESPLRFSEPKPFVNMPIDWAHAYGGEGSLLNPAGLGVKPKTPFTYWPLPNIETTALKRSFEDQSAPAGYGMIGVLDPRRNRNLGTYDRNWVETRWPYFPDDFDSVYFNCAEQDQRLKEGFFNPGDPIVIHNMHPAQPELHSRLPHLRHRVFIVQQQGDKEVFVETPLQIDTVWLWPERERGLLLARGMFPIADDDADDVKLMFAATERLSDPPLSLDEWHEELKRRLVRKVPFDLSPLISDLDDTLKNSTAKLKSLPDELRKLKADIDFDRPSAMPKMSAEKMEEDILRDEAKIAALVENPEYGTAIQVGALRKAVKARRAGALALREAAIKKQEAVGKLAASFRGGTELPSVKMQAQLQQLKLSHPEQYAKIVAELGKADESMQSANLQMADAKQRMMDSLMDDSVKAKPLLRPTESLAKTEQDLMLKWDEVFEQLKLQDALKTDGLSVLDREMAAKKLEMLENGLKQVRSGIEKIVAANAKKDAMLDRFIEMTESMTQDL